MTRGLLGRADLLRAVAGKSDVEAERIAVLLGFLYEPPLPHEPQLPLPAPAGEIPDPGESPEFTAPDATPMVFWRADRFTERSVAPRPETPPIRPVWRNAPRKPPVFHALCPWPQLEPRLRRFLSADRCTGDIDIPAIVHEWSLGRLVGELPHEWARRWPWQVQVVLDRSRHLWPFAHDQTLVAEALRGFISPNRIDFALCHEAADEPRMLDWRSGRLSPYTLPASGTVVLVLGDLGCLNACDADATARWEAFGNRLTEAGCHAAALLPCAVERCPESLRLAWRVLPWERPKATVATEDGLADRLLMLVSPAVRIEPGLLRAVRRALMSGVADAGIESEVWQHPAIISDDPRAATLHQDAARNLRAAFATEKRETQRHVLWLLAQWRHGLKHEIWFEEVANLAPETQALLPSPQDTTDSEDFFAWLLDGSIASSAAIRDWLLRLSARVTDHGWRIAALAEALIAVKGEDFDPPEGVSIDRIAPRGPPEPIELRQRGGDVIGVSTTDGNAPGSLLGVLWSGNGRYEIETTSDADSFWASGIAPSWAHDWGTDAYGPWVTFRVPDRRGGWVEQRMRWCPQGRFIMGSPEDEEGHFDDEEPQHVVTFAQGFWMFDTACTEQLWTAVLNRRTKSRKVGLFPITHVSWQDAQDFIAALNAMKPGLALSLPSEAQWEYACRAGSTAAYSFGDTIQPSQVNFNTGGTVPAGSLPSNAWGLHEMHGNVWEWCADHWHGNYEGAPADGSAWIDDKQAAAARVLRGGSWFLGARRVRSAYRIHGDPARRGDYAGFRCARVQAASGAEQVAAPADPASRPGAERGRPQGPTRAATLLRVGEATSCPAPRSGALLIRSDREELRFRRFEKPAWASAIGRDRFGLFTEFTVPGTEVSQRMRWVPPGWFDMGSPDDEPGRYDDEGPVHRVTIAEGYWLFDTPCTQALWQAVMSDNPSRFQSPTRPVEQVSYKDVLRFLTEMNDRLPGLDLSLPSEAQWEYACRAGTQTSTYAGPMEILGANNAPILDAIAWYGGNSGKGFELASGRDSADWLEKQYDHTQAGSRPVALKAPNPWGLYDMLGNVWEWCADEWHRTYDGAPTGGAPWIDDNKAAAYRVLRGGSWSFEARGVRSASRYHVDPAHRDDGAGFRCARVQSASVATAGAQGGEEQAQRAERGAATTSPKRAGGTRVPKLRRQRR